MLLGAPLNSPVVKAASPTENTGKASFTTSTTSTLNPTSTSTGTPEVLKKDTPVASVPGMNPLHGQECHDCAVAVGALLHKNKKILFLISQKGNFILVDF